MKLTKQDKKLIQILESIQAEVLKKDGQQGIERFNTDFERFKEIAINKEDMMLLYVPMLEIYGRYL